MNIVTFLISHPRVVTVINILIMVSGLSGLSFLPVHRSAQRQ
jgi:multidrug efflux pump subunit AcrB